MQQIDFAFIEATHRRIETPAFRRTDPETSELAAKRITDNNARAIQRSQTADAIRRNPNHTMQELAELTGLDRYILGRRVSECETAGDVVSRPKRRCTVTGFMAHPWVPVGYVDP